MLSERFNIELIKIANKAARMLKEKGLKKGDKVAVIMENSAHYIIRLGYLIITTSLFL